jgi:hypothetical protein
MYLSGLTIAQIARSLGKRHGSVCRLLTKHNLSIKDHRKKGSIPWAEYQKLRDIGADVKYSSQRNMALDRGIGWELTFADWWHIWETSGHYAQRGRRRGEYVMARIGDTGPYAVGNVEIITCSQNVKDARARDERDGRGISVRVRKQIHEGES